MTDVVRPPCAELLRVVQAIDQMIAQYRVALRSVAAVGEWEAPQEGFALGWLLVRNVEAVILMARHDEVLVTAAWSNVRTAFELSARIIWMLQPDDRYEAECRWLAFLSEWESIERKLVQEVPEREELHTARAQAIRDFREGAIRALPSDYRPPRMPNFRDMLIALDNPQMYRFYREARNIYTAACMQELIIVRISELCGSWVTSLLLLIGFFHCDCAGCLFEKLLDLFCSAWKPRKERCLIGMR